MKLKLIIIFFVILNFLLENNQVIACNLNLKTFGSSPENQENIYPKVNFKDKKNNFITILPIENFCSEVNLKGSAAIFTYVENQLAKITIERHNYNDRNLLKYAINQFGDFKRSKAQDEEKWVGSHFWNLNYQIVGYIAVDNNTNKFEKIELTSTLYNKESMNNSSILEK